MAKTLRVRTRTGWTTKPAEDTDLNRLTAEEIDDTFLAIEDESVPYTGATGNVDLGDNAIQAQRLVIPAKSSAADPANVLGGTTEHSSYGVSILDILSDETWGYSHCLRLAHAGLAAQNNAWLHMYSPGGNHMVKFDYVGADQTAVIQFLDTAESVKARLTVGTDQQTQFHFGNNTPISNSRVSVAGNIAATGTVLVDTDKPLIPSGGATGHVLKKSSAANYDTEWAEESGGTSGIDTTQARRIALIFG